MKEVDDLIEQEEIVLFIACQVLDYSLSAHVPKKAITNKIKDMNPKYLRKAFNSLISNGFLVEHPTRRNITYGLTPKGLRAGTIIYHRKFGNLSY
ncbi:MAG: hypothetical protein ACFFDF_22480 [Candidatus Odinarchaeota archaeon]